MKPTDERISAADTRLLEALPAAIYMTDAEGRITYYNKAAMDLWGGRPELGNSRWCGAWRLFNPDGTPLPLSECPIAVTLRTGEPIRGREAIAERPDGSRVRFLPYPTAIKDDAGKIVGAINMLIDVSGRHEAEVVAQRLAAIVASSDDAIVGKTLDGTITSWNAGATRMFGYSEDEMIGQNIKTIIPPELYTEEEMVLARLRRGERIDHYETVRVARDGRRVDISLTVSPIRASSGEIIGASKVARDISQHKQAEKTQAMLIGELSHRVKNTLAIVQAMANQSLSHARDPAEFVASFAGRILSLAKAHDLLSDAHWEGVEIGALIRDQVLLGVTDDRIRYSGPGLTLDAQRGLHVAMILHELGTNARKYGAISKATGRLTIEWQVMQRRDDRELHMQWDESGGPPVTAQARSGFGTTLIENGLTAHGGSVSLEYAASGLKAHLRLPLPQLKYGPSAYAASALTAEASEMDDTPPLLLGKRILVVEDELLIAMEIEMLLTESGCTVIGPVGDADLAISLLSQRCDAALLDANLHGERADVLAAALTRAGVPFAFVTGYGKEALPPPFRDAMIVSKPFTRRHLLSAVSLLLKRATDPAIHHIGSTGSLGG